ncbi:MAG TPA: carboxypeptidase-like regulatory domain-containing protein [Pyrinomonadaceae bacterium]|nr:carboxypeptidase-like regulatory domain-containing protein [Pyrinomonadaceae bacterium]
MKTRISLRSAARFLSAALLVGVFALTAFAQGGTSTVRGTVKDPQGNVVAGANVKLISVGTAAERSTTTSEEGIFGFEAVQVGDYRLEVEAGGFKKGVVTDIHALIASPVTLDVQLEIGNVSESVTVSTSSAELLVNREDGTLGTNFVNKQITQLPLEARSVPNLLTLQTAATRDGYVAGARADQTNVTLDGVDINEAQTNSVTSGTADPANGTAIDNLTPSNGTVLRLNADAIEEFRVQTTNPNANQGRSAGAQVSLVTKGGTNDWHGSAFEFYRTSAFQANDFFNNAAGVSRAPLIRHTFGGSLGGPIVKDRAFFFYSFEGDRIQRSVSVVRNVPLASLGQGLVRYRNPEGGVTTLTPANIADIFPEVGTNPAAISFLAQAAAKYPANDFTIGDQFNTAGFRFNAPTPVKRNSHTAKFDFNLTSKQQAFLRTSVIYDVITRERQFPDTPAPNIWSHPMGIAAGHTWTITNNVVNTFRYGYTREAFSQQGDSAANSISFRFVFSPFQFSRTLTRITPVHNFTDDLSWVKGNHTIAFGTNLRSISNKRVSFANSYDDAITNPSFFLGGGSSISNPIDDVFPIQGSAVGVQNAVTAIIGRFSQYSGNFIFDHDGNLQDIGTPSEREFATQEYDWYGQDSWKITPNLTLTYGMRYTLSRPVYEKNGFEVRTDIPLSEVFELRQAAAARGENFVQPLTLVLSGPANNAAPLYSWDKNNFQPRVAVAWSPSFGDGFLGKIFGRNHQSVFRGGFAITNDYYGQQLAVSFDLNNTLGFSSSDGISANTYDFFDSLAPLFTGLNQSIRTLPNISTPGNISFPRTQPFNSNPAFQSARIESTLDSAIRAPINYSWNFTYERELPKGLVIQTSYIGRMARNLIAARDVMALNNLVDPKSGMDWYTAAGMLEQFRRAGTPIDQIPNIPWFQNMLPTSILLDGNPVSFAQAMDEIYFGTCCDVFPTYNLSQTQAVYAVALNFYGNDWTDTQDVIEDGLGRNIFFHPQYGALSAFSSIARSNYHAGTLSIRERLGRSLTMDFNYTLSHSMDDASGLQTSDAFGGAFILNPLRQRDNFANSDFDVRHIINANAVWELPFGRGRRYFSGVNKLANAFLGGWQMSGIFRWNSGLPMFSPYDDARWATNWNAQSSGVRIRPIESCPTQGGKLFGDCLFEAYKSWRGASAGETGDRNVLRLPGYVNLDMGLSKSFDMPWSETQKLQIRFEVFNVTNTQRMFGMDTSRSGFGLQLDPDQITSVDDIPSNWSNFTSIQGQPRVMQVGARFTF